MKNHVFKKYVYAGLTALSVLAISLLLFFFLQNLELFRTGVGTILHILTPVIYGAVIAYVLSPVYNRLRSQLQSLFARRSCGLTPKAERTSSALAILLSILIMLALIAGLLAMIIPELVRSVANLMDSFSMSDGFISFSEIVHRVVNNDEMEVELMKLYVQFEQNVQDFIQNYITPYVQNIFDYLSVGLLNTVNFLKNFIIGIIIAVYLLASKEQFAAQATKLLYCAAGPRVGNAIMDNLRYTHQMFGGFIMGKLLDSAIIGVICCIGLSLIPGMPYVMLISVVIGVTNIIPFFGPFIGAIPSAILILLTSPIHAVYFIIFILVLQQFDGNILGPKILGQSTGLSSFWVLFSILVFGGLFGFVGMIIGVPIMAVLLHLLTDGVNRLLTRRGLPLTTDAYAQVDSIDEETGEIRKRQTQPEPQAAPEEQASEGGASSQS
ncbi:MAG: AI-2E family transporter [Butyricicoccaceae bacterium]